MDREALYQKQTRILTMVGARHGPRFPEETQ